MTTPSEQLAAKIVDRLVREKLLVEADAGKITDKIIQEKMKPEEWRLYIEKGIDAGERS